MIRRMLIQYASDLHLEMRQSWSKILKPVAPILVLAGDIGDPTSQDYRSFLDWCGSQWKATFIVAGNHEFYNSSSCYKWKHLVHVDTHAERLAECRRVADMVVTRNVHFLQQRRVDLDGVAFLGATLWTDLSAPADADIAVRNMNDYQKIATATATATPEAITPIDTTDWHRADYRWLDHEIKTCEESGTPAVVITHHLPSYSLIASRWTDHPINSAFASRSDALIRSPVKAWIAGHTHAGTVQNRNNIALLINPLGYPGERGTFKSSCTVEIDTAPVPVDERIPELVAAAVSVDESTPESEIIFMQ